MRNKPKPYQHNPLPPKPQSCTLCHYVSTLGQNDLQLHLDREHKGWAEGVIRKMDIRETGSDTAAPESDPPKE